MKRVLIIGNGFDIAHNLPTKYSDYLHMNEIVGQYINKDMWTDDKPTREGIASLADPVDYGLFYVFGSSLGKEKTERFDRISKECFWIQHFLSEKNKLGDKWIDFESEIEEFIGRLVAYFRQNLSSTRVVTSVPFESLNRYLIAQNKLGQISENELFDILHKDYEILIESMELYMGCYINKLQRNPIENILQEKYDRILSFNYTNTFERLYPNNGYCCYIHGNATKNKIVLGYQNQEESVLKRQKEEILYQKYYQRIVNKTDNTYLDWLSDRSDFIELSIYGHSLSPADGDVLKAFITKLLTKTTIYCINEPDRAEKIRNLAIILGADSLQSRAGGRSPSIEFKIIKNTELADAPQLIR